VASIRSSKRSGRQGTLGDEHVRLRARPDDRQQGGLQRGGVGEIRRRSQRRPACEPGDLGYAGKEIAQPALELLGLVRELGARLACFDHTVTELQGVLGGIANGLRNPRRRAALTLSRVEEHFVREGLGPSDIEVFLNTVERDLRTLGINVRPTPRYEEHLGVDEPALEDLLQAEVGYQNQNARRHDLDALTAIWRLRHGQAQRRLETCRAIFVTTNAPLVRAARRFFAAGYDGFTWPLAVLDHDLATVAWLKRPLQAPDLPRKQIIADCYAAPPT
jgi:hypothetical protein